ncbi:uncharacterized protein LOC111999267 isoform X1 [Quercus suber]|uniref:uncharacterized protein LOC111999267 isoform X1 n=1 Tax=Quercus suber TaxID=58331 RepID=UPI0032DFA1AD
MMGPQQSLKRKSNQTPPLLRVFPEAKVTMGPQQSLKRKSNQTPPLLFVDWCHFGALGASVGLLLLWTRGVVEKIDGAVENYSVYVHLFV